MLDRKTWNLLGRPVNAEEAVQEAFLCVFTQPIFS